MITIITVGKIKEKYIREGIDDYLKRLSKFTKIELVELEDESFDKAKTLKNILKKHYILKHTQFKKANAEFPSWRSRTESD